LSLKLFAEKTAALSPLRLPAVDKPPTIAYGLRELPPSRMTAAPSMPCAPMDALGVLAPVAVVDHFRVAARVR
jgi:arylformamidase